MRFPSGHSSRGRVPAGVAALAFILLNPHAADPFQGMAERGRSAPVPVSGPATIRALFPDGSAATGATVTAGGKSFVADGAGEVHSPSLPARQGVVSAEIARKEGGVFGLFRSTVRYEGFHATEIRAGEPVDIRVTLKPVTDPDGSCRSCHPEKGSAVQPLVRCVHRSGVPLKPEQAARVRQFNTENEALRKAGKQAYPAISVEEKRERFLGEKKSVLVCRSCHTNHVESGQKAYVTMPFLEQSVLCKGCHV